MDATIRFAVDRISLMKYHKAMCDTPLKKFRQERDRERDEPSRQQHRILSPQKLHLERIFEDLRRRSSIRRAPPPEVSISSSSYEEARCKDVL